MLISIAHKLTSELESAELMATQESAQDAKSIGIMARRGGHLSAGRDLRQCQRRDNQLDRVHRVIGGR